MHSKKDIAARLRRIADALDPQPEPEAPPAPVVFTWPTYPTWIGGSYYCAVCGQWVAPNDAGHFHFTSNTNTNDATFTVAERSF